MIRAVEGVNLTVKKGECLALVGESGCGKSMTSLSCMKLQPSLAAVRLDQLCICGEDVTDYTDRQMQALRGSKISMIFQDALTALNPVMTIGKQMDEIYRCHEKISKKEAKMRSIKALKAVGIPDAELRYHAFPHELSGGMRQRVLIAMAFACEPEVIIADEPTTALDVTIQAQILELLSKMQKEKQTALLLITHDLSVVRSMADRIRFTRIQKGLWRQWRALMTTKKNLYRYPDICRTRRISRQAVISTRAVRMRRQRVERQCRY